MPVSGQPSPPQTTTEPPTAARRTPCHESAETPLTPASLASQAAALELAVNRLDAEPRQILRWRYWNQLSFAEIARLLGVTPADAKLEWLQALEQLRAVHPPP